MAPRKRIAWLVVLAGAVAATPLPMVAPPSEWPLDRMVTNLEQRVKEAPDDGVAHYNLGRTYGFAFALQRSSLWGSLKGIGPVSDLDEQRERFAGRPPESIAPAQALERLGGGVFHLRRACELDPVSEGPDYERGWMQQWGAAHEHLTFAWLLETGAHLAARVDTVRLLGLDATSLPSREVPDVERWIADLGSSDAARAAAALDALSAPEHLAKAVPLLQPHTASPDARRQRAVAALLERFWLERAIAEYALAYEQNAVRELDPSGPELSGPELGSLVSYEALLAYDRLVRRRGVRGPEEEARLLAMEETKKRLETEPRGEFITPLIVRLEGCRTLDELIAPNLSVPFDLDGDGIDELWPWLAPGTGWLVWDPERRGEITSGRQLFGTPSAWLFFADGYRVLDALDDDRSGELRGPELAGIAVWFDRDTDGISDRGEVVPVEELGIVALATESTLRVGPSPANLCGLELADGRVLPTYDWVLEPSPVP